MNKVLVIVGPTASGKSNLAVRLAKKFKGEIISADSRQVYKGLNIGTGKITKKEMQSIPHHLLSIVHPKNQFTVAEYKSLGEKMIEKIFSINKLPIIAGGTGFYIDALTQATSLPEVPPNKKLREKLNKKSAEELFEELSKRDPRRAQSIDRFNKVRLIRALEIVESIGKVPPVSKNLADNSRFVFIGLKLDQTELHNKIYTRLIKRIPGMIKEARRLHANGLSWKRMEELGLEYRYLARLLQKKITKEEFIRELNSEIRKYAKRQYTWFKRNKNIKWFKPSEFRSIENYARIALYKGL